MNAKQKILVAADELFGRIGFDSTTTREIAERSGVNKALIHYHFKNKEALFTVLLDDYYERLTGILCQALATEAPLEKKLYVMVDSYAEFLAENRNFGRIVQREAAGGAHVNRIHEHMEPLFQMGARLLKNAIPETKKGELSAEHLMVSVYGMIISYFTYSDMVGRLTGSDPLSKRSLVERKKHVHRMVSIILESISGTGPEAH